MMRGVVAGCRVQYQRLILFALEIVFTALGVKRDAISARAFGFRGGGLFDDERRRGIIQRNHVYLSRIYVCDQPHYHSRPSALNNSATRRDTTHDIGERLGERCLLIVRQEVFLGVRVLGPCPLMVAIVDRTAIADRAQSCAQDLFSSCCELSTNRSAATGGLCGPMSVR